MTQVQTVTQLAFLPRLFPINCYLVEEADGFTLIDTGMAFVTMALWLRSLS